MNERSLRDGARASYNCIYVTRAPRPLRLHSAFASEFCAGDFLAPHNDLGDGRAIAFTLSLARDWRADRTAFTLATAQHKPIRLAASA